MEVALTNIIYPQRVPGNARGLRETWSGSIINILGVQCATLLASPEFRKSPRVSQSHAAQ